MASHFYIPGAADGMMITPAVDSAWTDSTLLQRVHLTTYLRALSMVTREWSGATGVLTKIIFFQGISDPMPSGQVILGAGGIKMQCRILGSYATKQFLALGIRVLAADGVTVQKVILAVTKDNVAATGVLTNRQFTAVGAEGDYTTVTDDRLVFEGGIWQLA